MGSDSKLRKNSREEKKIVAIFLLCLIFALGITYYIDIGVDASRAQNENANRFGVSFMTMNNPFFTVISDSIRTIVEANGDIVIVRDPSLDSDRQIEQIRNMIDEKVNVIFISPVDYEKIIPVVQEARQKGIVVIFVDTEVYDESLADGIVVSDNYLAGVQCARYLMEQKSSAKIFILEHTRTKSGNDRVKGFEDTIAGNENYIIVDKENAEGQLEIAMPITRDVQESGLSFDTVFAINDLSALGAMAALKEAGRLSSVGVLGVDGAPEAKAMIKENLMLATSAQYPSKIGDLAVDQAYKILNGEEYQKKILVNVELITKDNVQNYGTNGWQ